MTDCPPSRHTLRLQANNAGLARAADMLSAGKLVAFPTETVYGLGASARHDAAVSGIYEAKGRPSFNPLIVHVATLESAQNYCEFNADALTLAREFWPGPLTLVLPLKKGAKQLISPLVTAGLDTLALRIPSLPLARQLLQTFGGAVAAPSANPSGRVSATSAAHVYGGLEGKIDAVVEGGSCHVGVESTIISCAARPTLLRSGGVPLEALQACLGCDLQMQTELDHAPNGSSNMPRQKPTAPGQLTSHYAPLGSLRLNAHQAQGGEIFVGFGDMACDFNLSASRDLTEAAINLFATLHQLDAMGAQKIAVAPIPEQGLGLAINDRLRRAAAPRTG